MSITILAILPKCPACVVVYLGLFGSFGGYLVQGATKVWPLVLLACIAQLACAVWRLPRRDLCGPALLVIAAAGLALCARGTDSQALAMPAALSLLGVAAVWQRLSMRRVKNPIPTPESCCREVRGGELASHGGRV